MTLAVEELTRRFGRTTVLDGAALEAADGERIALLGPNGSGKTTLLRVAAGILRPTAGRVLHDGTPTTKPEGRRGLALVPQDAVVYPELTVREHVSWWARVHGAPHADPDADALLDDAGLRRLATESAGSLSRGQRQRLAVCMALAVRPRTLLLDEPTTGLDDAGRDWLTERLREHPATLLVATHEPDFADALGARRLHLDGGRLR